MLERLVLPPWLRFSLALPLLVLNLWVLRQLLVPLAPFPALFLTAGLIAFVLDIPTRWLVERNLPRTLALLVVIGLGLGGVVLAALWLVPRLVQQLDGLLQQRRRFHQRFKQRTARCGIRHRALEYTQQVVGLLPAAHTAGAAARR
jgi:predicted PurR-regulated permease PerM